MFLQLNIIDVKTRRRRMQTLTLLTGWEGIGLYALTFTTMTQNNFCIVISPLELNTRSIPFPIAMLLLRVRYFRFRFNTCAAVIFATIRCLRYFESDFKSLKINLPSPRLLYPATNLCIVT